MTGSDLAAWRGFMNRVRTLIGQVRRLVDAGQLPTDDLVAEVDGLTTDLGAAVEVLVERTLAPKPVAITVPIRRFDMSGRALNETPSTPVLSGVMGWKGGPVTAPRKGRPPTDPRTLTWQTYPVRINRTPHRRCVLCQQAIRYGDRVCDGGRHTRRAHASCVLSREDA